MVNTPLRTLGAGQTHPGSGAGVISGPQVADSTFVVSRVRSI